jgi:hypothetical protein
MKEPIEPVACWRTSLLRGRARKRLHRHDPGHVIRHGQHGKMQTAPTDRRDACPPKGEQPTEAS